MRRDRNAKVLEQQVKRQLRIEEQLLGYGEQPWITSTSVGAIAVWSSRRDGELMMKNVLSDKVLSIATKARDAVLVTEPVQGKSVFVFWEQNEGARSTIYAKTVESASW